MAEDRHTQAGPRVDRPQMPDGYGVPQDRKGLLPWSFVDERMAAARNYWIGSVRPNGRPHAVPVWGVWLDDHFYFDGSPETRHLRNLAANPAVNVHLESGDQVVILEGTVSPVGKPDPDFARRLVAAYSAKYASAGYEPTPDTWDRGGLYRVEPHTVLAWAKFPQDVTRWKF